MNNELRNLRKKLVKKECKDKDGEKTNKFPVSTPTFWQPNADKQRRAQEAISTSDGRGRLTNVGSFFNGDGPFDITDFDITESDSTNLLYNGVGIMFNKTRYNRI